MTSAPPPTITTTTRQVVLDVVVTDGHGHPVRGLKQSDFTLLEDGIPQTLVHFTEHDGNPPSPEAAPDADLPPNTFADHPPITNDVALTAIILDASFFEAPYVRSQLAEFAKTVPPQTAICIFRTDTDGLHLVQDFTTDPETIREAASSKRSVQRLLPMPQQTRTLSLLSLAHYLSSFPGRKNLIWFTSGISPYDPLRDTTDFVRDAKGITDTLTLSRVALYPVDARGLTSPVPEPGDLEPVNGNGIPTGFDPGVDYEVNKGQWLQEVAAKTGGRAYYNVNAFKKILAEVVDTGSHYYTLSYNPTNPHWNGDFRNIKVHTSYHPDASIVQKVGEVMLGSEPWLFYRTGYYARDHTSRINPAAKAPIGSISTRKLISYSPKGDPGGPGHALLPKPTAMDAALKFASIPPFQIHFTATFTPSPTVEQLKPNVSWPRNNFLAAPWRAVPFRQYSIHYWISPNQLRFSSANPLSYHDELQLITLVYTDDGTQVNSIVTTGDFSLNPEEYVRVLHEGLVVDQTIAIPVKGNFFLRTGVQEMPTDRIGALEVPVESIKLSPEPVTKAKSN